MGGKWTPERAVTAVATGGGSEITKVVTDKMKPDMPATPDLAAQRAAAEAEAQASQMKDINLKNSGVASTVLGGATSDDSNLKKKKLLGE